MYNNKNTTTMSDAFPVVDISHKPKRMQGDAIKAQYSEEDSESKGIVESVPSKNLTLEKVIHYCEDNAKGEYSALYRQIALWLRELLTNRAKIVSKPSDEVVQTPVVSVDVGTTADVDKAKELLDKAKGTAL